MYCSSNKSNPYMTITVTMPEFATERYRRQALRTRLDVVVTIGGILGLFLGASILSGIEFVYYFTLRLWNNYRMRQRHQLSWMERNNLNTLKIIAALVRNLIKILFNVYNFRKLAFQRKTKILKKSVGIPVDNIWWVSELNYFKILQKQIYSIQCIILSKKNSVRNE